VFDTVSRYPSRPRSVTVCFLRLMHRNYKRSSFILLHSRSPVETLLLDTATLYLAFDAAVSLASSERASCNGRLFVVHSTPWVRFPHLFFLEFTENAALYSFLYTSCPKRPHLYLSKRQHSPSAPVRSPPRPDS